MKRTIHPPLPPFPSSKGGEEGGWRGKGRVGREKRGRAEGEDGWFHRAQCCICIVQGIVNAAKYIRDKIVNEQLLDAAFNSDPVVIVCCRCVSL